MRASTESAFIVLTGMRSAYFCRIRSASALRFSNGCSSLNLERILPVSCSQVSDGLVTLLMIMIAGFVAVVCCCRRWKKEDEGVEVKLGYQQVVEGL